VKGISSNSSSPTDTWIIVLYNKIQRAALPVFVKIFIADPGRAHMSPFMRNEISIVAAGLMYEANIYEKIIRRFIDEGVCPHFVYNYDVSTSCSFNYLAQNLARSRMFSGPDVSPQESLRSARE